MARTQIKVIDSSPSAFKWLHGFRFSSGNTLDLMSDHFRLVNLSLERIQRKVSLGIERQKSKTSKTLTTTTTLGHLHSIRSMMADIWAFCQTPSLCLICSVRGNFLPSTS